MKPLKLIWVTLLTGCSVTLLVVTVLSTDLSAQTTGTAAGEVPPRQAQLAQAQLIRSQRAQIKQIRQTVPPGAQRREAITAVITPQQKEQMQQGSQESGSPTKVQDD